MATRVGVKEKLKSAGRLGLKGLVVAGAILGVKAGYDKHKEEAKEAVGEAVAQKIARVAVAPRQPAGGAQANVEFIAQQGVEAAKAGVKAGAKQAVKNVVVAPIPKRMGGGGGVDPKVAAQRAAAPAVMAGQAQAALVAEVGAKQAAQAIQDRDALRRGKVERQAPVVGAGVFNPEMSRAACQGLCMSKNPSGKGRKYNKCIKKCK